MVREEATKKNVERECLEALRAMGLNPDTTDKVLHSQEFVTGRRAVLLRLRRELGVMKRFLGAWAELMR